MHVYFIQGKKRDVVWTYCEIEKKDGGLQGHCGEDEHVDVRQIICLLVVDF